jgi:hypothetical protein
MQDPDRSHLKTASDAWRNKMQAGKDSQVANTDEELAQCIVRTMRLVNVDVNDKEKHSEYVKACANSAVCEIWDNYFELCNSGTDAETALLKAEVQWVRKKLQNFRKQCG